MFKISSSSSLFTIGRHCLMSSCSFIKDSQTCDYSPEMSQKNISCSRKTLLQNIHINHSLVSLSMCFKVLATFKNGLFYAFESSNRQSFMSTVRKVQWHHLSSIENFRIWHLSLTKCNVRGRVLEIHKSKGLNYLKVRQDKAWMCMGNIFKIPINNGD